MKLIHPFVNLTLLTQRVHLVLRVRMDCLVKPGNDIG